MRIRTKLQFLLLSAAVFVGHGCATAPAAVVADSHYGAFRHAAVAADHPTASLAGAEILALGGNAVDAAVATSFTLSVVRPYSCGIGGGGFMLIYDPAAPEAERAIVLNYREVAPASVGPDHYVKLNDPDANRYGVHSSGVPGTVAGLLYALEHYGTLDRATVLAPAIRAAEEGFPVDQSYIEALEEARADYARLGDREPFATSRQHFPFGGSDLEPGDIVTNPAQARALRLIARDGADAFYRGEIGQSIVRIMREHGGTITAQDLADYRVQVRRPIVGQFLDYEILAMPPPSSGGIALLQMFGMLERRIDDVRGSPMVTGSYIHVLAEMMKHAFADRAEWLADDAFVDVPIDDLLAPAYLDELAGRIDHARTFPPDHYGSRRPPPDDGGTSHFSVIDANGMAVACTETINLTFGSLVLVPEFGFMLNDEMDDFTTIPGAANEYGLVQSERNLPAPGKRPLSSMSPTMVIRDEQVQIVAGASGGPRIITATFQTIVNASFFNFDAGSAVERPRCHHQWLPDRIELEDILTFPLITAGLEQKGHATRERDEIGVVQMLIVRDGVIQAASDPRKGGRPAGY